MSTYTDHLKGTTYTDFHNKLKETVMISCGYHDLSSKGVTEQLLKLYNPGNEYYGTFKGSIDLCGVPLSGVHLCGVTIEDAQLCSSIRLADGIELSSLEDDIAGLDYKLRTFEDLTNRDIASIKEFDRNIELSTHKLELSVKNLAIRSSADVNMKIKQLSNDLSTYSNSLCASLSVTVDKNVVKAKAELSNVLSSYSNDLCASLSNQVINDIISTKYELSNVLSSYSNKLCTDISTAVDKNGYLDISSFDFKYSENFIVFTASDKNGGVTELSINSALFEKNRELSTVGRIERDGVHYLELVFKLEDGNQKRIEIPLSTFYHLYKEGDGIAIDESSLVISADQTIARVGYVDQKDGELSDEIQVDKKDIKGLSSSVDDMSISVDVIYKNSINQMKFIGHAGKEHKNPYNSFEELILDQRLNFEDLKLIRNGSTTIFEAIEKTEALSVIDRGNVVEIGFGDVMVVHDHEVKHLIDLSNLTMQGDNRNIYLIKAGASRYEYEDLISQVSAVSTLLSSELTSQISAVSVDLSSQLTSQLNVVSTDLSNAIDNKIFIEDRISNLISGNSDLSIVKISKDEYELSVAEDCALCSNVLYVVESDYIDAYGQQIKNLSKPSDLSDATPKWYVDEICASISSTSEEKLSALDRKVSNICSDLSIALSDEISRSERREDQLSSHIENKIFIEDKISNLISGNSDLSIVKISKDEYELSVANDCDLCSNVLYVVESDYIDVYGQQIKNLSKPYDLSDATPKWYVDDLCSSLSNSVVHDIVSTKSELSNVLSSYSDKLCSDISTSLVNEITRARSKEDGLSSAIDSKIFIDGVSSSFLSLMHIGQNEYYQKVLDGEISDNVLYVLSGEFINAYGNQIKNIADPTDSSDATTKQYVDMISGSMSSEVLAELDSLSTRLSNAIDNKIFIEDRISNFISGNSDLSIIKISKDEYELSVANDCDLCSNVLYVVESDFIDAYGQQIKNLSGPSDLSDATNKKYVDMISGSISAEVLTELDSLSTRLSNSIDSKIFIEDKISNLISGNSDLSIIKISKDEYELSVAENCDLCDNVLYVVESDFIDAYGQQLKNLSGPYDLSDATPKWYVDEICSSISTSVGNDIKNAKYELSNDLSSYTDQICSQLSIQLISEIIRAESIVSKLSSEIDSKIFIDGVSASFLSLMHIDQNEYYQKLIDKQLSDNVIYVISGEFVNIYGMQIKNIADPTDSSDATTKQYVDMISGSMSSEVITELDSLSSDLSNAIDNKIFIEDRINNFISGNSDLSIIKISKDEYELSVSEDCALCDNVLYVVESDYIDAYGQQIKNLSKPSDLSDATPKWYVDIASVSNLVVPSVSASAGKIIDNIKKDGNSLCIEFRDLTSDTLSGTLQINGELSINGNYFQTDDSTHVKNFSGKNAFVQAECSNKYFGRYGIACTGSKGYCILSALKTGSPIGTGSLKLSGDLKQLEDFIKTNPNELFSMTLDSGAESMKYKVLSVDGQWAYLDLPIGMSVPSTTESEKFYTDLWYGYEDNGLYCPKDPTVGNAVIPSMYGNHIEGAATKALQRCTHAEGRNTIADIRYSHAEGSDTIAGQMYAHAEGVNNKALGLASHAEGSATTASGDFSHTEGSSTVASGKASHASGANATSKDDYAFTWSGAGSYSSHGQGTFNIKPNGGLGGFFVGDKPIMSFMNALSVAFEGVSDIGNVSERNVFTALSMIYEELKRR